MKLEEMSFEDLNAGLKKIDSYIKESGGEVSKNVLDNRKKIGTAIMNKAQNTVDDSKVMLESGLISEEYFNDIADELEPIYQKGFDIAHPYYTESVTGNGLKVAATEVAAFTSKIYTGLNLSTYLPVDLAFEALTTPAKKFIMARLNKYTVLYPEAISFKQFESDKYTLEEAIDKFKLKPKFADKWNALGARVNVKVYTYKKKPVMCIMYTGAYNSLNSKVNLETFIMDSSFKKHEDYYTACITTQLRLSHPASYRVLKQMSDKWKSVEKKEAKAIKEEVEELELSGRGKEIDHKLELIEEAVKDNFMDRETADFYRGFITSAQINALNNEF